MPSAYLRPVLDAKNIFIFQQSVDSEVTVSTHKHFVVGVGQKIIHDLFPFAIVLDKKSGIYRRSVLEDIPRNAISVRDGVIEFRPPFGRNNFYNNVHVKLNRWSFPRVVERYKGFDGAVFNWFLHAFDVHVYPCSLILPHLLANSTNAILGRLRLLLGNHKLFSSIPFVLNSSSSGGFRLTGHDLSLVGHHLDLHEYEASSQCSSGKSVQSDPVTPPRNYQRLPGDGDSLLLKRFEIVPANLLYKQWFRLFASVFGFALCGLGVRLYSRNDSLEQRLTDRARAELMFLLTFVGFLIVRHYGLLL